MSLPLPRVIRTSDDCTRAVEYATDLRLLPQVLSWTRTASRSTSPATVAAASAAATQMFTDAVDHARGPVRLVVTRHPDRSVDLAIMDHGRREDAPPPGGGMDQITGLASWGWYGDDERGHRVWARIRPSGTL
ncbi:hypothetical protein [Nocardiopsis alba]|uniref:hypothetical protein n=1 Tax=Nocardiopsis alba TaxID=53437 RepID=UPI0033BC6363